MLRVAVIAPHMDDEVLGVGGTIARHVAQGDHVSVCIVANRAYNHVYDPVRIEQQKEAARRAQVILGYHELFFLDLDDEQLDHKIIDVVVPLEAFIRSCNPEIVYVNHRGDSNQDHKAVFQASVIACRTFANPGIKKVLCYEVLSSTEQAPAFGEYAFVPNCYCSVESCIDKKVSALKCYDDELRVFPHPRSEQGIKILAQKRGMEIGAIYAESFMVVREKWME